MLGEKEMAIRLEKLETLLLKHDNEIKTIFKYLKTLIQESKNKAEQSARKRIGFKKHD